MKSTKSKKGDSVISMPLVLMFGVLCILIFTIFISNTCMTYIWYEKMQGIALKYIYILEEYGYLTEKEKENIVEEMVASGFNKDGIDIYSTDSQQDYGNQVFLDIRYKYRYNKIGTIIGDNHLNTKEIPMRIYKITYSKK